MNGMKRAAVLLLAVAMLLPLCACKHEHVWEEATCTEPKTCIVCGETEGEPLGHSWKEATCTEPVTCRECGKKKGEPLGHTWKEATCEEPKTCTVCGATEGEPKGHAWADATCVKPRTCTVCGATEGGALGHEAGSWTTIREATISSPGYEERKCTRCGAQIDSRTTERAKITYSGGKFNFTRDEFVDLMLDMINYSHTIRDTGELDPFGGRAYAVFDSNGDLKAVLSFIENSRGEVTAIKVWGKEKEMIFLGVATFIIVCGDENLSDGSEEIFNSLLEKNYCIRKGFKVVFKDEGDGYGSFTITGA